MSAPMPTAYGGRYAVLERAGIGGMADVFRAHDQLLGREVAVKVLNRRFARDRAFVERFRREAQAVANLSHPNIVSLYDFGSEDDTYFIVMEYIEGRSLEDITQKEAPLLPERAVEIAADVARALDRAHKAGLVHRDVKPSNIMLSSSGTAKVTDFGIVRALSANGEQTMTQAGTVIGTAAYLSPEQAQGKALDARTDVYSLGVVLFEMITARTPFSGDTPLAIAYKHVRERPPVPSWINRDVSADLDAVVLKAMAKNPDNRYDSAAELLYDLERFLAGIPVAATPVLDSKGRVELSSAQGAVESTVDEDEDDAYTDEPRGRGLGALLYVLGALVILAGFALLAFFLAQDLLGV